MSESLHFIYTEIEQVCGRFALEKPPYVVGVNGLDCSGKTVFACGLAEFLRKAGHAVELLHIDDFNDPIVQGEVYASFMEGQFTPELLTRFYEGSVDYARAAHAIWDLSRGPGLVVVEGVFLYKDELTGLFDYKIYLEVDAEVGEERFRRRRDAEGDLRPVSVYRELWVPAHERYVREREPKNHAHLVIDNNEFLRPRIVSCGQ